MKKITAIRKNEYLSIYSDAPCLTWIDAIIKTRIRADYTDVESDIREKVICIIQELSSQISEAAIKKAKIRRNKRQDLSSHILKILILAGIHDELEAYYEEKKDFQKRFSFDELLEDLNAYYIQIGSYNLPEIAYSEYSRPAYAELFDATINSVRELFKSNSQQAFNDAVENVIKLNANYLAYQFPK